MDHSFINMESKKYSSMSFLNMNLPHVHLIILILVSYSAKAQEVIASEISSGSRLETYLVHVKFPGNIGALAEPADLESWYHSFLPKSTEAGEEDSSRMVHTYRNVMTGFAAKLSPEEVKEMEKMDGFYFARPQKRLSLHTTHSPNFLGLHTNLGAKPGSNFGEGVIIGVLDTGITPEHPSFNDEGVNPPPPKWKGKCEFDGMVCNNKLIGARNFVSDSPGRPYDVDGHGTHTAGTAGGNFVKDASVFGMANGTAAGMAPRAHIAMYKVCSEDGCSTVDIMAAMDAAVEDGVDILSLSLGGPSDDFYNEVIALGAFDAIRKGIFVSCSAGNSGPKNSLLSNEAPWILTVGASTIDRKIVATVLLGNMEIYDGESAFQPSDFPTTFMPLVDAAGDSEDQTTSLCGPGSLDGIDVRGKAVLCMRGDDIGLIPKGQTVKDAGGAAMILMNNKLDGYSTMADPHVLPATHVSYAAGQRIKSYIRSTSKPMATILFRGTVIGDPHAPSIASFSSRGPSLASPGILKPDITGPGVSIVAAWPVSVDNITKETAGFNIISGTSMSCPHLAGIAAILKSAHPDWSPAAIKSAIMTTASQYNLGGSPITDERGLPADVLAIGAGHVNPPSANDPGLIYDLEPSDYIPYLCGLGYNDQAVEMIVHSTVKCSEIKSIPEAQLNYPSFAVELGGATKTYTRTVTNIGEANSSYSIEIESVPGVEVTVAPDTLVFTGVNQKMTYQISFSKSAHPKTTTFVQGALVWRSEKRAVRSPISQIFGYANQEQRLESIETEHRNCEILAGLIRNYKQGVRIY